jgi:UDP-2-acetamido-3-amino-2,3-dideoxy-glucuronate N-acetyltransferase
VIHPTAEVEAGATVGAGTRVWHYVHIRSGATVGEDCNIGYGVYIDAGAVIGNNVKLQNRVSVYRGVTLENGVFVGPNATFTNDKYPRAITPAGEALSDEDWQTAATLVRFGASIGAGAVVLPGITIGRWAMVGAGSLVARDVPDQALVVGVPARHVGYACLCGRPLDWRGGTSWECPHCHGTYSFPEVRRD